MKHKNWTNNTVRTLIKRLLNKSAIKIVKKTGRTYTYKPTINEEQYQKKQLQHFVDTVLRGDKNKLKILGEEI